MFEDLPLPLITLVYGQENRLSVLDIANILAKVTIQGGGHEFRGNNCFWFAATSYETVKAAFSATGKKSE